MKNRTPRTGTLTTRLSALALLFFFAANVSVASAHMWTVDVNNVPTLVEAKLVDFDGRQVLLEATNGVRKAVDVNDLNKDDQRYLRNFLIARQAVLQQTTVPQRTQGQVGAQFFGLPLERSDMWDLLLYAPDGTSITRRYPGRTNQEAFQLALQDFPNARIAAARRVSSFRGRFNVFY